MKSKGLSPIIIYLIIIAAVVLIGAGVLFFYNPSIKPGPTENRPINNPIVNGRPDPVACTMEAKLCPDGSYVGRTGPNCEFSPCPSSVSTVGNLCSGTGDLSCGTGYQCIQDCGAPVARENDPPPLYHCVTNETAIRPRTCPICLASNALIATPNGDILVSQIVKGMKVWSVDEAGRKVAGTVTEINKTEVAQSHQVVHLVMADNREVWVSPNHPLVNGQSVGSLKVGDVYDGSRIIVAALVQYWDNYTYDILPDSATGQYWADGILLGSTLFK